MSVQKGAPINWPVVATYPLFVYDAYLSYKSFRDPKFVSDEHAESVKSAHISPELVKAVGSGVPGLVFPALVLADNLVPPENWYFSRFALLPLLGARSAEIITPPQMPRARLLGYLLFLLGGSIRLSAVKGLKKYFKARSETVRPQKNVIREGPYRLVRHPSYLGALAMLFAASQLALTGKTGTKLFGFRSNLKGEAGTYALAAAITYYFGFKKFVEPRIAQEEAKLQEKFSSDWHSYSSEVPYRLFPGVY